MKTRKQQPLAKKRADRRPPTRKAAPRRPLHGKTVAHGKIAARGKAARGKTAAHGKAAAGTPSSFSLAADCTVAEAESLKSELACRLNESGPVTLDVGALQRIDTAGLQLLAAFVRDRRTAGRTVAWHGRAAALEAAAGLLGLQDMLELPREAGR